MGVTYLSLNCNRIRALPVLLRLINSVLCVKLGEHFRGWLLNLAGKNSFGLNLININVIYVGLIIVLFLIQALIIAYYSIVYTYEILCSCKSIINSDRS